MNPSIARACLSELSLRHLEAATNLQESSPAHHYHRVTMELLDEAHASLAANPGTLASVLSVFPEIGNTTSDLGFQHWTTQGALDRLGLIRDRLAQSANGNGAITEALGHLDGLMYHIETQDQVIPAQIGGVISAAFGL